MVPVGDGAPEFFENQLPDDYEAELAVAEAHGARRFRPDDPEFLDIIDEGDGVVKWVVDETGQLWVSPKFVGNQELKHGWLAGGGRVRAAGEARIAAAGDEAFGISIGPQSGHYLNGATTSASAASVSRGRDAFAAFGITFP